jgi:16S rRNA (cytosine967-C5)-methyltransferase
LVYSTCSLEPEECEQVVEGVMAEAEFATTIRVLPLEPLLDDLKAAGQFREPLADAVRGAYLRTLPGVHPGDGFFAALLERRR